MYLIFISLLFNIQAGKRGIPVKIFRPGRIIGDSKIVGATAIEDVFSRIIKGCLQIEKAPMDDAMSTWPVDMNPVD